MSRFLSLDNTQEVPLACVTVGQDKENLNYEIGTGPALTGPKAEKKTGLSISVVYPLLQKIYNLGKTVLQDNGVDSQETQVVTARPQKTIHFSDFRESSIKMNYMDMVIHRRSKRNFIPKPLDINKAVSLIRLASSLFQPPPDNTDRVDPYLAFGISCQNVQGLDDGFYLFSRDRLSLLLIRKGRFQNNLSRVCLDQKWISNAAMNFLFMANLSGMEKSFGPRGYRCILTQSGRIAQRIYLAATGLGLGCCGVGALYDEEAQNLFDLNKESALFYTVSTGPVKK